MLIPENKVELRGRRTVNSKHYDNGDGSIVGNFGVGHQHYWNKLGVGDSKDDWRSIDWTLTAKDGGGWTFVYHSFHPDIPQYADGWLGFRDVYGDKDQTLAFKGPSHIEGRLITAEDLATEGLSGLTSVNAVIYDDAFGEGKDYVVYFTRSAMLKCGRVRSAYKGTNEIRMRWYFIPPEGAEIWRVDSVNDYKLDTTRPKEFDTAKRTELRTASGTTFFRPFKMWDSGTKSQVCVVEYGIDENGMYLEKVIPASFLAEAEGDVFCDTTTSYYVGAKDGRVIHTWKNSTESWATARASATSAENGATTMAPYVGHRLTQDDYYIGRCFIPADTSAIGAFATVMSASGKVYKTTDDDATDGDIGLYPTSQDPTIDLTTGDWTKMTFALVSSKQKTDSSSVGYLTFDLTDLSYVNKSGWTKLGITTCDYDAANSPPGDNVFVRVTLATSEDTSGTKDPYLSVTYIYTFRITF